MVWQIFLATCFGGTLFAYVVRYLRAPGFQVNQKHVFITGGSAGLGLATAKEYAKADAKITLVSRSVATLEAAKKSILQSFPDAQVFICACDVTEYEQVKMAVEKAIVFHGEPIYHLICCAGLAIPGYFVETSLDVFYKQMQVNFYGTLHATKVVVPHMIATETHGRVIFVSSGCGYIGFIGYTQYCPTKYALRGFADSLRNELKLYDIGISIFYPGNMDTPGFQVEERTKPDETREIEGTSKLVSAESAAQSMLNGISYGDFAITNDIGVWLLRVLGNGVAPRKNVVLETILLPLLVVIQTVFVLFMDSVVGKSKKVKKA